MNYIKCIPKESTYPISLSGCEAVMVLSGVYCCVGVLFKAGVQSSLIALQLVSVLSFLAGQSL